MGRLAANLTFLFTELPIMARFKAAKNAGFSGVEMLFPYDMDVARAAKTMRRLGLSFVCMNAPPPNWAGGPRGFAAVPGLEARFRSDFERALRYAEVLGSRHIHLMAGRAKGPEADAVMIDNLRWACHRAPHASLLIEPLNPIDSPEYHLSGFEQAEAVIEAVAAPNLGLLFDAYHAHRICGDVAAAWSRFGPLVRHVQVASLNARSQPDPDAAPGSDIDYRGFFAALRASNYQGWIAGEYAPSEGTTASLGWMKAV